MTFQSDRTRSLCRPWTLVIKQVPFCCSNSSSACLCSKVLQSPKRSYRYANCLAKTAVGIKGLSRKNKYSLCSSANLGSTLWSIVKTLDHVGCARRCVLRSSLPLTVSSDAQSQVGTPQGWWPTALAGRACSKLLTGGTQNLRMASNTAAGLLQTSGKLASLKGMFRV